MLHSDNPLAQGLLDEQPDDLEYYGYDPDVPTCMGEDNNVVVEPIECDHAQAIESYVLSYLDPIKESSDMAVDIFCEALDMAATFNHWNGKSSSFRAFYTYKWHF